MALRTLSSPAAPTGGTTLTFTVSGGTWSTITVDPTKFTINATSAGFDSAGAPTSTVRTFTAVTATHAAGTITIETSEPFFSGDTSVTVAVTQGGLDDGTDQNAALTSTAVTNNSTLAAPLVCGLQFVNAAHQRHTTTIPIELTCAHRFGIAAVQFGITYRSVVTTDAGGITGTGVYPSAVTFSGGATGRIAPGSTLTGAGAPRTVHVFIESGTVTAAETATITNGGATFTVGSVAGGGQTTSTQTAMSTVTRSGTYGPAPVYDLWRAELTPPSVGVYQRWAIAYPVVGLAFDTRSRTRHTTSAVSGQSCSGEDETYGDPGDTEALLQKTYYVDSTLSAACGASTVAAFQAFEFCAVRTGGTLSAVVLAIGTSADGTQAVGSTSFRYNTLANFNDAAAVHTMTLAGDPTGGNPAVGNIITLTSTYTGSHPTGIVLSYDSGTRVLTYVKTSSAAFSSGNAVRCLTNNAVATGVTFTAATPSAAVGTTVSSGDVVTGFTSGATCTLSGAPAANGNNASAGTIGAPFATMMRAMRTTTTDRGDSLCDGATIYLEPGTHRQDYSGALAAESRFYWINFTAAPGVSRDLVRITKWNVTNSNGHYTNFQRYANVTLWSVYTSSQTILSASTSIQGNFPAPSVWLDSCYVLHNSRWQRSQTHANVQTSGGFAYSIATNCNTLRFTVSAHVVRDQFIGSFANDILTLTWAAMNVDADDTNATGTDAHADGFQLQAAEGGNRMIWNLRTLNNSFFQPAPFINCGGSTNPPAQCAFVNMLQAIDDTANIGSVSVASGTSVWTNWLWINCSTEDAWAMNPSAGATLSMSNIYMVESVWADIQRTAVGTTNGLAACWFTNQHRILNSGGSVAAGYLTTTASSLTDLVVSLDDNAADFFAPKTGGLLLNRAGTRPNGYPRRDVVGNMLSVDGTAKASVGARQPVATVTATVDGNAITSGGSAAATGVSGGSTTLVFTVGGPTGAVLVVDAGSVGGGLSAMVPPTLPRTLTSGGTTTTATFTATLGSSPGTFNVGTDALADFTGTVTWASGSDFPFRARMGGSFRNPTGIRRR
jgi:hypothetical protein